MTEPKIYLSPVDPRVIGIEGTAEQAEAYMAERGMKKIPGSEDWGLKCPACKSARTLGNLDGSTVCQDCHKIISPATCEPVSYPIPPSERFAYIKYDAESVRLQTQFREIFEQLEFLGKMAIRDSRPKSLFMTSLEEAYLWIGKAIRDDQIERQRKAGVKTEEQPERKNG